MPNLYTFTITLKTRWKWETQQTGWRPLRISGFPLEWTDSQTGEISGGYKQHDYLPEAV